MLSYNVAATLLELCNIPYDIQKQILLLFIGLGTYTSNIIKKEITLDEEKNNMFNGIAIIHENEIFTLWRFNVSLKKLTNLKTCTFNNFEVFHEIRIAYLSDSSHEIERISCIESSTKIIKNIKAANLFNMFYNMDKYNYWLKPYGTQSSIVIRNAINIGIIKEFKPMLYYGVDDIDSADEYY